MKITVALSQRMILGLVLALAVSLPAAWAGSHADAEQTLFQLDEKDYRASDLPLNVQQALYDAELQYYSARKAVVDEALLTMELEKQAKATGQSMEEAAEAMLGGAEVSDEDIKAFYEENKARIQQPLEGIEPQIKQVLEQQAQVAKQNEVLEGIKADSVFKLGFAEPLAPVTAIDISGFPYKGAEDGKAVLVEFADYQCPHCKRAGDVLKKVAEQFKDDLKIVFMDFPVNRSGISRKIAQGAACAAKQDKFWEYHDLAFSDQRALNDEAVKGLAETLELDMSAFDSCLESDYPAEQVKRGQEQGERLGVNSTPTLFLNGRRLKLNDMEKDLSDAIKEVL